MGLAKKLHFFSISISINSSVSFLFISHSLINCISWGCFRTDSIESMSPASPFSAKNLIAFCRTWFLSIWISSHRQSLPPWHLISSIILRRRHLGCPILEFPNLNLTSLHTRMQKKWTLFSDGTILSNLEPRTRKTESLQLKSYSQRRMPLSFIILIPFVSQCHIKSGSIHNPGLEEGRKEPFSRNIFKTSGTMMPHFYKLVSSQASLLIIVTCIGGGVVSFLSWGTKFSIENLFAKSTFLNHPNPNW